MVEYEYICTACKKSLIFAQSIEAFLPDKIKCPRCSDIMQQNFSPANIIFKGDWPGKDIKQTTEKERDEKRWQEVESAQKEANEILKVRRKGRKAYNEFATHNPQAIQRYNENMKKGIKGR